MGAVGCDGAAVCAGMSLGAVSGVGWVDACDREPADRSLASATIWDVTAGSGSSGAACRGRRPSTAAIVTALCARTDAIVSSTRSGDGQRTLIPIMTQTPIALKIVTAVDTST